MGIKIQSIALMLLLVISFFGMAYGEDATDGTKSEQSSRDRVYDITDEITAAFEATPTTMPAGSAGIVLDSTPVIDAKGRTWWEVQYKNKDGTTTTGWSADVGLQPEISSGDEVKTTSNLNVRDAAGTEAKSIKVMPVESTGTILDSPPEIDAEGRTWWEVQYKNKDGTTTTGWSADVGLQPEISSGDEVTTTRGVNVRNAPDGVSIPSPSSYNNYDTGIVSYGKHQFTVDSGSLYDVLVKYTTLSQSDTSKNMVEVPENGKSYLSRVKEKDATLRDDDGFRDLLTKAASEPQMVQAQDDIFKQYYYDDAKEKADADAKKMGFTDDKSASPLAIVIYTDAAVNHGQGGLNEIRRRTEASLEGTKYDEQGWLNKFLEERRNYLLVDCTNSNPGSAKFYKEAASSKGRVGILLNLVNTGNLDLKHGDEGDDFDQIAIGDKGKVYAIDAPLRREKEVGTSGLGDTSLAADMLKIGFPLLTPDIIWFSDQTSGKSDSSGTASSSETSGTSYINKIKGDVWFIDMYSPSFVNRIAFYNPAYDWSVKPPIPMDLPSGEPNKYGYDFIDLPGMDEHFTEMYLNWVRTYLNYIGAGANGGYGPLLDDGGGW